MQWILETMFLYIWTFKLAPYQLDLDLVVYSRNLSGHVFSGVEHSFWGYMHVVTYL